MRCPKCGYITFDFIETCRKCQKPMGISEFNGTTFPGAAPVFLTVPKQVSSESTGKRAADDMMDLLDPDLDLLAEPEDDMIVFEETGSGEEDSFSSEGEIAVGGDFGGGMGAASKGPQLSLDEDDLMIDTSRFENVPTGFVTEQTVPLQMTLPDELADISDLSRPAMEQAPAPAVVGQQQELDDDLDFSDLKLDDLGLTDKTSIPVAGSEKPRDRMLEDLSLDDIDLSGDLSGGSSPKIAQSPTLDDDLNFDLDLGSLGTGSGKTDRKSDDDLPDLHLSLD